VRRLSYDKDYFAALRRCVKNDRWQSLTILIGLPSLFALTLLYLEARVIAAKTFFILFVGVSTPTVVLLQTRMKKKTGVKTPTEHDFDPVSLGILYFGAGLSLLSLSIVEHIGGLSVLIVAVFFSLASLAFFCAVFSSSTRGFINRRAGPVVMSLTFIAAIPGFVLGLLPALSQGSGVVPAVATYFGIAWVVAILVTLFRDMENELLRLLFVIFFVIAAVMRFFQHDVVGAIGGIFLIGIAALLYVVATGRLRPYGKV